MTIRKGQVINPEGRNQKKPISEAIRVMLHRDAYDSLNDKPKTIAQVIALRLIKDAVAGENYLPACKEVLDRTEGKPAQSVIGGDDDDPPIKHAVDIRPQITREEWLKNNGII